MEEKTMSYLVLYSLSMLLATSECKKNEKVYDGVNHEDMLDNCTGKNYTDYCNEIGVCQPGTHIMCMYYGSGQRSGPACRNGRMIKLDNGTKNIIMEKINTVRTGMSSATIRGKNDELLPKAKNGLAKLEWDSELALFAQVWANQCEMLAEDTCRATQNFFNPGQMVAVTAYIMPARDTNSTCIKRTDLNGAIDEFFETWQQDIKHVTSKDIQKYEIIEIDGEYRRNNFLTLVNGRTTHVGCGLSAYEGYEFIGEEYEKVYIELVCNLSSQPIEEEPVYDYELVTTTETTAEVKTDNTNNEATDKSPKIPNKEISIKLAKVTTDNINREKSDKSAEVTTDNTNKETSDKSAEVKTNNTNNETTDKSPEVTTDNPNKDTSDKLAEVTTDNTNKETSDKSAEVTTDNTNKETSDKSAEATTDNTNKEKSDKSAEVTTARNRDSSSSEKASQEGYGNGNGQRPTVLILPIITVEDAPGDKYLQKLSLINENLRGYSNKVLSSKNVLRDMNKPAFQKPRTSKKGYLKKVLSSKNLPHNMNKQALQKPRTSKKDSIFTRVPTFHLPSQNNDSRTDKLQENVLLRHKLKALLEKVPRKDLSRLKEALKLLKRKQGRRVNQLSDISPLLNLNVYNEVNLTNEEVPKIQNVDIRLKYNTPLRRIDETDDDLLSATKGALKITDYGKEPRLIYGDKTKYPEKYWSRRNKVPDNSIRNTEINDKWAVNTVFGNIKDRNRAVEIQSQFNSIPTMRKQIPIVHAKENNVADEKYSKLHNQGYFNPHRNDNSINNYIKDTNVQEQTGKFLDRGKIVLDDSKSKRRMYLENEIYKLKRELHHLRQYIRRNDISENDRFRPVVEPHNRRQNIKLKGVENFYMPDRAHSLHEF